NATTQAEHVHVVVLDTLVRGIGVVAQRGVNSRHLVGGDARADAAAAHHDPALYLTGNHRPRHRLGEIGIVDRALGAVRAQVHNLVPLLAERPRQRFLQRKSGVVGGNCELHTMFSLMRAVARSSLSRLYPYPPKYA